MDSKIIQGPFHGENRIEKLLQKKLGKMPDVQVTQDGKHADLMVSRSTIEESGKAVLWLDSVITGLEQEERFKGSDLVESLKGMYVVFRDCALMARHYLGYRDLNTPPQFRQYDLIFRFTEDPKEAGRLNMEIGTAVPKNAVRKEPEDDD